MNNLTAAKNILRYLASTFPGNFVDTVRNRQPNIGNDEINADLHCHPNIKCLEDLFHTIEVCKENNVDLVAIIQHYNSKNPHNSDEMDYWEVLELAKRRLSIETSDGKLCFRSVTTSFIGGYEFYGTLDGVKGHLDLVTIMTDKGFKEKIGEGKSVKELVKICRDYGGIVIASHPYTIWDPYRPFKKIVFRLADEDERKRVRDDLFPLVDTVDLVASNTLWMLESNRLVQEDYKGKPLCNSDAHSKSRSLKREIGRSGNIFQEKYLVGDLRDGLRENIRIGNFRSYLNYMPLRQFMLGIVSSAFFNLDKLNKDK